MILFICNWITNKNTMTFHVYVKLAYTDKTKTYELEETMTINELVTFIINNAYTDLEIETTEQLEIVETGQFNNPNGRDPELAPAFISSDETLIERFRENSKFASFYVRVTRRLQ
jgi:hypothetical protein